MCLFCKAGVFQPVFQAGMQAEAGRTLASTAGECPGALSKWVREGGTVEAWARDFVWFGEWVMRELLGKERPLGDGLRMGGLAPGTGCLGKSS